MIRALVVLALLATAAHAGTRRIAVVVGNNAGNAGETPLHFAETDAAKLARVLGELGGVEPADLFVLKGEGLAALTDAFNHAKRRVAEYRKDPANRVIVLFYFSGHSDGEALELGRDRLTFSDLRRWLATAGADVRVALVDSCKSGALLAAKGGTPGPSFQIRLTDDLASTGEVLLTSSAADEVALESREIGGSFFTHHFISGLRGAADASGDGLVTLGEAYQYAYARTIATTGETIVGPQHPGYDYRLSGQGELVLAELGKRTSTLALPSGFERVLVIDSREQVTAEITADAHPVIAVQPGRYTIRASRAGKTFVGRVSVAIAAARAVRADELAQVDAVATTSKGGGETSAPPWSMALGAGATTGIATGLGIVPALRAELVAPLGLQLALVASTRETLGFRESATLLYAGYRRTLVRGPASAFGGVELGGGVIAQTDMPVRATTGALGAGAFAGGALSLGQIALQLEGSLPIAAIRRDGHTAIVTLPAVWLGIAVPL